MKVSFASICLVIVDQSLKPKRARIPNCTHISMERVHLGRYGRCFVCGQVPSIGFLYECRQDHDPALQPTSEIGQDCDDATKSDLCRDLEEAGLSKSIIAAAEQHKYTDEQLEKLKTLKEEMKQVILDTLQSKHSNETAAKEDNTPSNNDGALNSTPVTVMVCKSPNHPNTSPREWQTLLGRFYFYNNAS